jgi:hypothetical protein
VRNSKVIVDFEILIKKLASLPILVLDSSSRFTVFGFQPPLWGGPPPPPPPFGPWGGHTRLRLRGWGSPNSDEGTYTVVLCICKYFVIKTVDTFNFRVFVSRN